MAAKNILIVDDENSIREMIKDVLELHGFQVDVASDGLEGIQRLSLIHPRPSLVILDLRMPGANGWKFLDYQRNDPELAKIPVVVCSAYKESARAIGSAGVIEKPIQLDLLLGVVQDFCA